MLLRRRRCWRRPAHCRLSTLPQPLACNARRDLLHPQRGGHLRGRPQQACRRQLEEGERPPCLSPLTAGARCFSACGSLCWAYDSPTSACQAEAAVQAYARCWASPSVCSFSLRLPEAPPRALPTAPMPPRPPPAALPPLPPWAPAPQPLLQRPAAAAAAAPHLPAVGSDFSRCPSISPLSHSASLAGA